MTALVPRPGAATVSFTLDGRAACAPRGVSLAAALRHADPQGLGLTRQSVSGQPRSALCGMGVCHECRVWVDGRRVLACQTPCTDGMRVETAP
jgi:aerobic-type carbon monoxide dehydrogenase small subunit (CoxS/CutS family)